MRTSLLFIFLFIQIPLSGQDISGKWTGNFSSTFLTSTQSLEVDIELYNDSLIKGKSHLYYNGDKYEHYVIEGVFHRQDSLVYFEEVSEIAVNLGIFGDNVMGNYTMKLSVRDNKARLEGKWRQNKGVGLMNSKVWLERKIPVEAKASSPKKEKKNVDTIRLKNKPVAKVIEKAAKRVDQTQHMLNIPRSESDSVVIEIKDDARIDNDYISLLLDDEVILHNKRISDKVISLPLKLTQGDYKLILVAENEGSMPPCTAQVTIITRNSREILKLEGNYKLNAVIKIKTE